MPENTFLWPWSLRALISLKRVIITKALNIIVKCCDGCDDWVHSLFLSMRPLSMSNHSSPKTTWNKIKSQISKITCSQHYQDMLFNCLCLLNTCRPRNMCFKKSFSRSPVSSTLKFCHRRSFTYAAPALWNGLPKDLRQFAYLPNSPPNLTYPLLALSSTTFHSQLKTELFKLLYPDSTPAPRHVRHRLVLIFESVISTWSTP